MEEEEGTLESFLKWAAELGISDSQSNSSSCLGQSLSVAHFPHAGGRGLAAVRDIRKGELILRVPKLALMSSESLRKDKKLSLSINNHASLSSTQILTVCLLYEVGKGKSSWWYPYLMHMPRSYDTLACFGQFETQALQVNDAIWAAEKATAKAEFDWKEAISLMEELNLKHRLQTFKAWLWASGSISSRTLHVPWDDAGCLCPVGDLFNYAAPGEEEAFNSENAFIDSSCWRNHSSTEQYEVEQIDANLLRLTDGGYEEDVSAYCFYARRNYKKGEQVLLSYGTYTNLELLEHYGFLLDENPNDKAFIPLESEIYSSCSWPKDSLYIQQNGKPSFALLSALRLWLTHPTRRRSVGHLAYSGSQLSPDNEIIVMGWIANNCKAVLKSFVTSIEEDELLLRTIDKMQDFCTSGGLANLPSAFEGEVHAFLENKGSIHGESGSNLLQSRQIRRYMDRWKLAVQWRLRYKRTLVDCITYCTKVISELPSENYSMTMRISTQNST
ncbi:Protein SET DOMAIN GROUP like [Actinidia chinensis var. chinensis]|uniref:Protein SET DOMAIN GROUP like n=1 Tax=Actinidia chinensis var. chinensis TaxID=1590841 RepID=A0A2R6S2X4_ACTCC|nr:Protein SET DOMAIN GROUP like [Actinidia chinensis var. chinensis]